MFVLKNYTPEELDTIKAWHCRYLVFGYHISEMNHIPSIQGYVHWNDAKTVYACEKLNAKISWRTCDMSPDAKRDKSMLDAVDIFEKGEKPKSQLTKALAGKRKWLEIVELAEAGNWTKLKRDYPTDFASNFPSLRAIYMDFVPVSDALPSQYHPMFNPGQTELSARCGENSNA
jgi:hypothetical protein